MSGLQQEVYEPFRAVNVPEDKAPKAAAALGKRDEETASAFTRRDADIVTLKVDMSALKTDVSALKTDVKIGLEKVNGQLALLKWMTGFVLASVVAMACKPFTR